MGVYDVLVAVMCFDRNKKRISFKTNTSKARLFWTNILLNNMATFFYSKDCQFHPSTYFPKTGYSRNMRETKYILTTTIILILLILILLIIKNFI